MIRRIKRNWDIPALAHYGVKGRITIRFFILRDGRVDGERILASSGIPPFDNAAFQAIARSSAFRPLPADLGSDREGVTVSFFYNVRPEDWEAYQPGEDPVSERGRLNDPATIAGALKTARTIAVVGCSPNPARPSNSIARYLIGAGYDVIPVNPRLGEVLGRRCYADLDAIPAGVAVDIVDVFRRSEFVAEVAEAALRRGVKLFWMQDGVADPDSADKLMAAGIPVVMDRCIYRDREALERRQPARLTIRRDTGRHRPSSRGYDEGSYADQNESHLTRGAPLGRDRLRNDPGGEPGLHEARLGREDARRAAPRRRPPRSRPPQSVVLPSFADIAEQVMPAIVSVTSTDIIKADKRPAAASTTSDRRADPSILLRPDGRRRGADDDEDQKEMSGGTGFIIEPDGYILTNNHVIEGAEKVEVKVGDKDDYKAKVVGRDPATDLALLKIDGDDAVPHRAARRLRKHPRGRMGHGDRRPAQLRQDRHRRASSPARAGTRASRARPRLSRTSSRPTRRSTSATRAARS